MNNIEAWVVSIKDQPTRHRVKAFLANYIPEFSEVPYTSAWRPNKQKEFLELFDNYNARFEEEMFRVVIDNYSNVQPVAYHNKYPHVQNWVIRTGCLILYDNHIAITMSIKDMERIESVKDKRWYEAIIRGFKIDLEPGLREMMLVVDKMNDKTLFHKVIL